jgi:signal-transduction protein with cAMP-binding, CBS, and nucleotidyltransferase domain
MTRKLETIVTSSTAQEAAKKMRDNNVSSLLVIDNKNNSKPIGIVTERDLVRKVCVNDASSKHTPVQECMFITSQYIIPIYYDEGIQPWYAALNSKIYAYRND